MFKGISTFHITGSYDVTDVEPTAAPPNGTTSVWKKSIFVSPVKAALLFVGVLLLIALVAILMAMFGPGSEDLKYHPRITGTNGEDDKGADHSESSTEAKPSTSTTGTNSYTSTSTHETRSSTATEHDTTQGPRVTTKSSTITTTEPPTTSSNNKPLQCGVAIVGGGVPGLLIAKELIQQNIETNVCLLEKEDHFGGRIYDHTFQQHVPNVSVGLGALKVEEEDLALKKILSELNVTTEDWNFVKPVQLEARGVFATGYSELKAKAFPSLLKHPKIENYSIEEIAIYISSNNSQPQLTHNLFSTAETFLSYFLSPEGAKFVEDAFGFSGRYMQLINPFSYRAYLWEAVNQKNSNRRPRNGMSELTNEMLKVLRNLGAKTFIKEEVKTINSASDKFILESTNMTVTAKKVVLTVTPMATRKMDGDVPRGIVDHEIFKSIQSVPAFIGAAVYNEAWWNDSFLPLNDYLRPLQQFVSSGDCLGITMPYEGRGPNGEALLQTMSTNGACSKKWADILKLSKSMLDKEMKRALEYKFNQPVPSPLDTQYKYWEEGYWFFQKPGQHYTPEEIRDWAKKPLIGKNVFLVGSGYYTFGGSLNDAILSAQNALRKIRKV